MLQFDTNLPCPWLRGRKTLALPTYVRQYQLRESEGQGQAQVKDNMMEKDKITMVCQVFFLTYFGGSKGEKVNNN